VKDVGVGQRKVSIVKRFLRKLDKKNEKEIVWIFIGIILLLISANI